MLKSITTCNAFLKRNSPVLNSHNNFQKDKALFFEKIKILNKFFFLWTMGSRPLNFAQICDFQNFAILKALSVLIGYFKIFWFYIFEQSCRSSFRICIVLHVLQVVQQRH